MLRVDGVVVQEATMVSIVKCVEKGCGGLERLEMRDVEYAGWERVKEEVERAKEKNKEGRF